MKKLNKIGYSLRDVTIVQAPISFQLSRKNVNPCVNVCNRNVLPIFVAPMSSVTDENNYKTWIDNNVTPIVPRTVMQRLTIKERLAIAHETFVSFSLQEAYKIYNSINKEDVKTYFDKVKKPIYICIDIAHGTLSSLYDICTKIKTVFSDNVIIMTGNIANPKAYINYCQAGIDYVRVGIGGGSRCFINGTKITMADNNKKNIEDVNIGEYVYTHLGNKQKVINKESYISYDDLININDQISTKNHKYYVINKSDKNKINNDNIHEYAYWLEAENVNKDLHFLLELDMNLNN